MQRRVLCNYLIPCCIMHHLLFDICVIDGSVRVVCWNESSITAPSQSKLKNMGRALIIIGCHIIMMNDVNNFVHMIWANAAKHYLSHFDLHYVCLDAGAPGLELAFKSWSIDLFLWRIKIIPSPSGRLSVGRPQMESNGLIWFQGKFLGSCVKRHSEMYTTRRSCAEACVYIMLWAVLIISFQQAP